MASKKDVQLAGLSSEERKVLGVLVTEEGGGLGVEDLLKAHPMSRPTANQILSRLHRKGWLRRIRRGLYTPVSVGSKVPDPAIESPMLLAMSLFEPCFISGWSAAEHWNLTEQIFNAISVVTTRRPRKTEESYGDITFRTRVVPPGRFFGAKNVWHGSKRFEIADPHRLIIDILDDPSFGGGGRQTLDIVGEYWKSEHFNQKVLLEYATRYSNGVLFKRLGFAAEKFGMKDNNWLDSCRSGVTKGISRLDPAGGSKGKIVSRWNLCINMPIEES